MSKVLLVFFTICFGFCFLSSCGPSTPGNPDSSTLGNPDLNTSGNPDPSTSGNPDSNTSGNPDPSNPGPPEDLTNADVKDLYIAQGSCWYKLSKNSDEDSTRVAYEYAVGANAEEVIDNYKKTCQVQAYAHSGGRYGIYAYTTEITVKPCLTTPLLISTCRNLL